MNDPIRDDLKWKPAPGGVISGHDFDNELTQLRARVERLEAICQRLAKFRVGPSQRMHGRWIGEVLAIAAEAREALDS